MRDIKSTSRRNGSLSPCQRLKASGTRGSGVIVSMKDYKSAGGRQLP